MPLVPEKFLLHKLEVPNCMVVTLGVLPFLTGTVLIQGCLDMEITTNAENSSQDTLAPFPCRQCIQVHLELTLGHNCVLDQSQHAESTTYKDGEGAEWWNMTENQKCADWLKITMYTVVGY